MKKITKKDIEKALLKMIEDIKKDNPEADTGELLKQIKNITKDLN